MTTVPGSMPEPGEGSVVDVAGHRFFHSERNGDPWVGPWDEGDQYHWAEILKLGTPTVVLLAAKQDPRPARGGV